MAMRLLTAILLIGMTLGAPVIGHGQDWIDTRLANGLRLIAVRDSRAPLVVSQLWYRVGSADESEGKSGLAHMLEHMMFKGTATTPKGLFSRTVARHGGQDNAATSHDYTVYYEKIRSSHLDLVLGLEADRMQHLLLDEQEFKAENSVVMEERLERTDSDPTARFLERFNQMALQPHPYGRPIIGWSDDIVRHTKTDLQQWYQRYYRPDNALLLLVGEMDLGQIVAQVEKHFAAIPASAGSVHEPDRPRWLPHGPRDALPHQRRRMEQVDPAAKLPLFHAAFLSPTLITARSESGATHDLTPEALDLLTLLLGDGLSSRLYQRLVVEERLAVAVDASYDDLAYDQDLWAVSIVPVNNQAMDRIEALFFEELQRLIDQPVGEQELRKVKNRLQANHIYRRDSLSRWAWMIGHAAINGLNWQQLAWSHPDRIEKVSADQLQQTVRRYLQPALAIIGRLSTS
ncbi:MAG: insulinase family protein [Magnetococcales bacterium]|nr:insulinase family protein [Magnetococcales bacterium]